ncbi:hypothetical protein [Vibrio sagamiensis]|uniref:Flavodoxin n=1 Tax=Vibrio sagamiensis NBRC 104589 TaxID=1219064 RepID=A0A511QFQ2_9VIBR|nr:hypothetical protein [Vibrio sagamiensis]PNQ64495.1 flavodoxin [Vibrio agarivorans]GEM76135.1 hypothetical protein VSA01S_22470 [Vibrio sagamiensis NBRC 104589]
MNKNQLECINSKNLWLHNLVEVEFPTKESLEGRKLYFQRLEKLSYQKLELDTLTQYEAVLSEEDIFRVDFHRLTVMYAVMQSKHWSDKHEQEMIIEYLTQIILTPGIDLYVGFKDGNPIGAAMVTQDEKTMLISDLFTSKSLSTSQFVCDLIRKITDIESLSKVVLLES